MKATAMPAIYQQHKIPEAIRALDVLPSDYVDVFTAATSGAIDTSPEEWARSSMEGASPIGRFMAWQTVLGLRLELRRSPDYIAGWKIVDRGDSWIRLEASGWSMTANIIFHVEEGQVSFATLMRYDRRVAALIWAPVSAVHRRLAPDFLGHGVKRILRSR